MRTRHFGNCAFERPLEQAVHHNLNQSELLNGYGQQLLSL